MAKILTRELIAQKAKSDRIESMKSLNMWGNNIEDVSIVSQMPSLEVISLSLNKIRTLKHFGNLRHLRELYLRQNLIADLKEIEYLQNCEDLKILWLNDNPISEKKNYRQYVLRALPQLAKLDDVMITDGEREDAMNGNDNAANDNYEDLQGENENFQRYEDEIKANKKKEYQPEKKNKSEEQYVTPSKKFRHSDLNDKSEENPFSGNALRRSDEKKASKREQNYEDNYRQPPRNIRQETPPQNPRERQNPRENQREYYENDNDNDNEEGESEEEEEPREQEDDIRELPRENEYSAGRYRRYQSAVLPRQYYGQQYGYPDERRRDDRYERREEREYERRPREPEISGIAKSVLLLVNELDRNELMIVRKKIDRLVNNY
ncbi:MAG: leucine-rich repeat protein [archaeon]|nr:leucine-rich repeat protein [archaeon]